VSKNVHTGAAVRAKRGKELRIHKLPPNYQTGGYKFKPMSGWNGTLERVVVSV